MSSPPASPGSFPSVPGSARDGWSGGNTAEGSSRASAALAAPPPSVARSDVSRLSADSHHSLHSIYSQRSRWSTAATLGGTSTVQQRLAPEQPVEPAEPLPEEMSGASSTISGEGEAGELQHPAALRARRLANGPAGARASGSTRSNGRAAAGATSPAVALHEAPGGMAGHPAASPSVTGQHSAQDARLPPRLIIFHPDGQTFGIGVDKLREEELQRAAEEAAAERRRQQRAAAADSGASAEGRASASAAREEGFDENYPGWRQLYARQKFILAGVLVLDVAYLVALLVLRLVWGNSDTDPRMSGAAEFFLGSHPESTSVSYLAGSLFTDLVALYGTIQNYASVITLFIIWSVVLGAFAILEMPLLFIIIRLLLLVAAFQLRFSMARLRNMLPPTTLGAYLSVAGRSVAETSSAVWAGASRPFRRRSQPAPAGPGAATAHAAPHAGRRSSSSMSTGLPAMPAAHASPVAAARSSALFRAALVRMMSEQRRAESELDLELGAAERLAQPRPQAVVLDASRARPAGSPAAGSSSRPGGPSEPRSAGAGSSTAAAAPVAAAAAEPGAGAHEEPAASDSLGRLYSRIMEDIAVVAAAPRSSSERRRQRRRERQRSSQRLAAAMSAVPASSSGANQQEPSALPVPAGGGGNGVSSDGEQRAPAAGASSSRPRSSSRRVQQSEEAIAAATGSGAQQRAAASASASPAPAGALPGAPTWAELMALLNFHTEQQQLRRQRHVDVVPLVCLTAPPPSAEDGQDGPGGRQGGREGA